MWRPDHLVLDPGVAAAVAGPGTVLQSEGHHLYRHQLRDTGGHAVPREGKETSRRVEVTLPDRSCLLPAKLPAARRGVKG